MQKGQSFGDAVKSVDVGEVIKAGVVGAVIGATGFAAAGLIASGTGALGAAGASVAVRAGAQIGGKLAVGALEGTVGQIGDNVTHGRTWNDDLGRAALFGAATAGATMAASAALRRGVGHFVTQQVRARALGMVDDSIREAHTIRSMRKSLRNWSRTEIDDTIANGRAQRTADWTQGRGPKNAAPATRFKNGTTGKTVTVNNQTGKIVQLSARNFRYDRYDFIARVKGWW